MTFSLELPDLIGLLGVAISIYSYARLQLRRDYAKDLGYSLWNALGAVLFEVSLSNHWNLSSFIGNLIWLLISLYGVYRCLKYKWHPAAAPLRVVPRDIAA